MHTLRPEHPPTTSPIILYEEQLSGTIQQVADPERIAAVARRHARIAQRTGDFMDTHYAYNSTGLNMEAVREFTSNKGWTTDPLYLTDCNGEELDAVLEKNGVSYLTPDEGAGLCASGIGLVIAHRNTEHEQQYGPLITEEVAIHELAHSAYRNRTTYYIAYRNGEISADTVRLGYRENIVNTDPAKDHVQKKGAFIEEGIVDEQRAHYAQLHDPRRIDPDRQIAYSKTHTDIKIPVRYTPLPINESAGGYPLLFIPSLASYALSILSSLDPELESCYEQSRFNTDAISETYTRFDSLRPGLARELRDLQYDEDDFAEGLRIAQDVAREHGFDRST